MLRCIVLKPLAPVLAPLIRLADAAYRRGTPLLSDAAFDRLARLAPNALPPLTTTLLSLDCPAEPEAWLSAHPGPYAVQLKADGVSVALIYEDGKLVAAHLRSGKSCLPAVLRSMPITTLPGNPPGRVEIRCEAIALAEAQPGYAPGAKQPSRNAVAAALRSSAAKPNAPRLTLLAFDIAGLPALDTQSACLKWLKCAGFACLDCLVANSEDEVMEYFDAFCLSQRSLPFACDGLVVKLLSKQEQRRLGNASRAPRWAISLKP